MVPSLAAGPTRISPRLHEVVSQRILFVSDSSGFPTPHLAILTHPGRDVYKSWWILGRGHVPRPPPSPDTALRATTCMYAPALLATWCSMLLAPVLGAVTWTATPFNPASVPLAVRTPYVSAWLPQGAGTALNAAWPTLWTGSVSRPRSQPSRSCSSFLFNQILGWAGYVKVDGTTYNWLGAPTVSGASKATQKSLTVSACLF